MQIGNTVNSCKFTNRVKRNILRGYPAVSYGYVLVKTKARYAFMPSIYNFKPCCQVHYNLTCKF